MASKAMREGAVVISVKTVIQQKTELEAVFYN